MLSISSIWNWFTNNGKEEMPRLRMSNRTVRSRSLERRYLAERNNIIIDDEESPACIDLTDEMPQGTEDVIDLTSPGVYKTPVLTSRRGRRRPTPNSQHRRRSGHSQPPHGRVEDSENEELPNLMPVRLGRSSPDITSLTDSDEDLPVFNFGGNNNRPQTLSTITSPVGKTTCPVCLDSDKTISQSRRQLNSTICGHVFCDVCIKSAIQLNKRCPTCRKPLSLKQVHPLFL